VLGEFGASLTSETLPDALPVVVGANCTLKVLDCPGGRVSGKVSPLMLKPGPVAPPRETVRLTLPVLLRPIACVLLLPTVTFPKATLAGLALSWPFPWGGVFLPATPPHPLIENQENRARMSRRLLARRKLLSPQLSGTWRWVEQYVIIFIVRYIPINWSPKAVLLPKGEYARVRGTTPGHTNTCTQDLQPGNCQPESSALGSQPCALLGLMHCGACREIRIRPTEAQSGKSGILREKNYEAPR